MKANFRKKARSLSSGQIALRGFLHTKRARPGDHTISMENGSYANLAKSFELVQPSEQIALGGEEGVPEEQKNFAFYLLCVSVTVAVAKHEGLRSRSWHFLQNPAGAA